jgi:hypothetical protein
MKINRKNGLRSAHGIDGKQINGILIRTPHTKSNTKFPSKLGAVILMELDHHGLFLADAHTVDHQRHGRVPLRSIIVHW